MARATWWRTAAWTASKAATRAAPATPISSASTAPSASTRRKMPHPRPASSRCDRGIHSRKKSTENSRSKYGTLRDYARDSVHRRSEGHYRPLVQSAHRLSLVGADRRISRMDVRHHGPAHFRAGARPGHERADARGNARRRSHLLQHHRHLGFYDRMGFGRTFLRDYGRPLGPRQNHDAHHPGLLQLHRAFGAVAKPVGLHDLPLPHRIGSGRRVRGGRHAGGGGDAGERARPCAGDVAGALGHWQRHRLGHQLRRSAALVALGFVLIYNVTGVLNFAQGEFSMLGALLCATLLAWHLSLGVAALLAVGAVCGIGALMERLAVEPAYDLTAGQARAGHPLTLVIITFGVSMALRGLALTAWGADPYTLPEFTPGPALVLVGGVLVRQAMWAIGRGLMSRPRVLLLDEPSLGLAPRVTREIAQALQALCRSDDLAVVLVEQNVKVAMMIADRVCVIERGRIVLRGRPDELLEHPGVRSAYLGKGYEVVG